jgi:hypothetical protein
MVEFSRIGSTTLAQPRRIHEKAQTPRTVADDALADPGYFAAVSLKSCKAALPPETVSARCRDESRIRLTIHNRDGCRLDGGLGDAFGKGEAMGRV